MKIPSSISTLCKQTPVVILAGGKGTRLMPYTTALPKPLMPVGNYPILEILLRQLAAFGFRDVTLAVGHLAGLIQAYFKDGRDLGLDLSYSYETTPLGTAGPLARIGRPNQSILVLNGDLLTDVDFGHIVRFHHENEATATVGMTRRVETVDFGVIEAEADGRIIDFREKPSMGYLVSMGIYVFAPTVLELIPTSVKFDFPDLLGRLLEQEARIVGYQSNAYWMDVGRPDDYEKANEDFPMKEHAFLNPHVEYETIGTGV
jgi:NDP-sugar pyrophosphorylase family protein